MAGYNACGAFIAKCLPVGENGPGRGHLHHIDTFLVHIYYMTPIVPKKTRTFNNVSAIKKSGTTFNCHTKHLMTAGQPLWLYPMHVQLVIRSLRVQSHRVWQHSFVEIDHEIFSMVILSLLLIQEGQLSVSGERICTSTG